MLKFVYISSIFLNSFLHGFHGIFRFFIVFPLNHVGFILILSLNGRTAYVSVLFIFYFAFWLAFVSNVLYAVFIHTVLVNRKPYKRTHDTVFGSNH